MENKIKVDRIAASNNFKINDRVIKLIKLLNKTPNSFATHIGLDRPEKIYNIINKRTKVSLDLAIKIIINCDINVYWILFGEGEVFVFNDINDLLKNKNKLINLYEQKLKRYERQNRSDS